MLPENNKDTHDMHHFLQLPMDDVRKLVDKLVELKFIENRDTYMRTHSNPLLVHICKVPVNFSGHKPEYYAMVACNTIAKVMCKIGENKVKTEMKSILHMDWL